MDNSYTRSRSSLRQTNRRPHDSLMFLLLYIVPFIVINGIIFVLVTSKPKFTLTVGETNDYLTTNISLEIKSFFPTKSVSVSMDTIPVKLTKKSRKLYTAPIEKNGVLEISVVNFNGMTSTTLEHINVLDDTPPLISQHELTDSHLTLLFDDSQSGIDYNSIYALDSLGTKIMPSSIDKLASTVTFLIEVNEFYIYVKDMSGNEAQANFTTHDSE